MTQVRLGIIHSTFDLKENKTKGPNEHRTRRSQKARLTQMTDSDVNHSSSKN